MTSKKPPTPPPSTPPATGIVLPPAAVPPAGGPPPADLPATQPSTLEAFVAAEGTKLLLKYAKGEWNANGEDYMGRRVTIHLSEAIWGWIRWQDGTKTDAVVGLMDSFKPPPRLELGDLDAAKWPYNDAKGERSDPWAFEIDQPCTDENDVDLLWPITSKGGRQALASLMKRWLGRHKRGEPVVELDSDDYMHRTYGKTHVPILRVWAWTDDGDATPPGISHAATAAAPFDDGVGDVGADGPAEAAPAATPKTATEPAPPPMSRHRYERLYGKTP
jgi:hypothetical protein